MDAGVDVRSAWEIKERQKKQGHGEWDWDWDE